MRTITLQLKLSNLTIVSLYDFGMLMLLLDVLNSLGIEIVLEDFFSQEKISADLYSQNRPEKVSAGFTDVRKESPTIITIEFTSIGAFWILASIADKIESWDLFFKNLDSQHENIVRDLSDAEQIDLYNDRDKVYEKLKSGYNRIILEELIDRFDSNPLKIEQILVINRKFAT